MTGLLDTSMVVRYLTGDPPHLAALAAAVIDGAPAVHVTGVVLAESAYVLMSGYGVPRHVVVDHLVGLLQKRNVAPYGLDKRAVLQALLMCRPSARVSFADALVWAAARGTPAKVVFALDERFPGDGIDVRQGLP